MNYIEKILKWQRAARAPVGEPEKRARERIRENAYFEKR